MLTINEQLFLVDGKESRLTVEPDSIVWRSAAAAVTGTANNDKSSSLSSSSATKHDTSKQLQSTKVESAANRLSFAQIIGTNHQEFVSPNKEKERKKKDKKLKLYYAKDNESRSSSQLLKIKSLTIESIQSSSSSSPSKSSPTKINELTTNLTGANEESKSATATTKISAQQKGDSEAHEVRDSSEPPSCYASEGSTSRLSSLSACSSPVQTSAPEPQSFAECRPLSSSGPNSTSPVVPPLDELCRLIEERLEGERLRSNRPRRLLIFVNPYGGKGKAVRVYKSKVRRLFALANVETKLVITKHANHARDTIEDPMFNVEHFDAIICIGGDGMFSELMNGLLFRYNRDKISAAAQVIVQHQQQHSISADQQQQQHGSLTPVVQGSPKLDSNQTSSGSSSSSSQSSDSDRDQLRRTSFDLDNLRAALGGIGHPLISPPIPIGVIGAGSTDANSFGLIGTNDVVTATLNIILGKQIHIDICSVHTIEEDRLLRFVSTFVAYGYFGDVARESEKLRWLGPSRYDVTGVNSLIKNRAYQGKVRILLSKEDGSPRDIKRCHTNCDLCRQLKDSPLDSDLKFLERRGSFVGVNAAVTACRCPQTKKGFSPNNHLANGCLDLILVRPCSRLQYLQYLLRTGWTKKSAFDLKYVEAYRCRQFEFLSQHDSSSTRDSLSSARPLGLSSNASSSSSSAISSSSTSNSSSLESKNGPSSSTSSQAKMDAERRQSSSWNVDGEILDAASIRVKVNNRLLRVFGTGEPYIGHMH